MYAWRHPAPQATDPDWLEACWEVDEIAPGAPPIAPYPRPRPTYAERLNRSIADDMAGRLLCPDPRRMVVLTDLTPRDSLLDWS